jgi:hypothetical protein
MRIGIHKKLWIDVAGIQIRFGSGFNGVPGLGFRRAKMTTKKKKLINIIFFKVLVLDRVFSFEGGRLLLKLGHPFRRPRDK